MTCVFEIKEENIDFSKKKSTYRSIIPRRLRNNRLLSVDIIIVSSKRLTARAQTTRREMRKSEWIDHLGRRMSMNRAIQVRHLMKTILLAGIMAGCCRSWRRNGSVAESSTRYSFTRFTDFLLELFEEFFVALAVEEILHVRLVSES